MKTIEFKVEGNPIPKGSTKSFVINGRATTTNANPKTKDWEMRVAHECQAVRNGFYIPKNGKDDGIGVEVDFYFQRPKSARKRVAMTVLPDIDKLLRCILDGLTNIVYDDDSQVIDVRVGKYYIEGDFPPYAHVVLHDRRKGQ